MRKRNGFAISTLIYGIFILFITLIGVLILTIESSLRLSTGKVKNNEIINNNDGSSSEIKQEGVEPNKPDIENTGLVPIKYDGTNCVVTSKYDGDWYDYYNQKWANAASLKSGVSTTPGTVLSTDNDIYAMFVWIPRFSYTIGCTDINKDGTINSKTSENYECLGYKIEGASDLAIATPGAIDIKFIGVDEKDELDIDGGTYPNYKYTSESDRNPTNWYTHPAFTFGDKELSGIWVGKFVITDTFDSPTILPNKKMYAPTNLSYNYNVAKKFGEIGNVYGITGDAHMAKNSEWAAVAYLSQSIYGKYGNSNYGGASKEIYINNSGKVDNGFKNPTNYYTGYSGRSQGAAPATSRYSSSGTYEYDVEINGTGASTTGNIYGIYDMVGGSYEFVMGNYMDQTGNISQLSLQKLGNYYNKFTNTQWMSKDTIGQGMGETQSWNNDNSSSFSESNPWIYRGGNYDGDHSAGVFAYYTNDGLFYESKTSRAVLVVNK